MKSTISGERFTITYRLTGSEADALAAAKDICIEQTVEFPEELINDEFIKNNIPGRIESFNAADKTGPGSVLLWKHRPWSLRSF